MKKFIAIFCLSLFLIFSSQIFATDATPAATSKAKPAVTAPQKDLSGFDANKDGKITKEEFIAKKKDEFSKMDKNKDMVLFASEYVTYKCSNKDEKAYAMTSKPMKKKMDKDKDNKLSDFECQIFWAEAFNNQDLNKDGKITLDEYTKYYAEIFDSVDEDKDGVITITEYHLYWAKKNAEELSKQAPADKTPAK